ncbi:HsdM family class I SAM-dependent methyltransferase [Catellatospora chokoriensis]|uniref:HsdM family class I SAM-dependent methyltransferase n=1 Tax=Catellatospora chokoriensis TaxID=310353 RepID=UPI001787571D|nr:N-6 DNA methylase [Catellatospora chokoriensis]
MSQEELAKKGYLTSSGIRGKRFGDFELLELGSTTVATLAKAGLDFTVAASVPFPCTRYRPPKKPGLTRPDSVYLHRVGSRLLPVAVAEWKDKSRLRSEDEDLEAAEQAVVAALSMGVNIAITTDGRRFRYIDAAASAAAGEIVEYQEVRDLAPGVLADLYRGESGLVRDPKALAENVWQTVWHATKAEPKDCLLTFVEIFMLKFLSDNLPFSVLPADYRFDALLPDEESFVGQKGKTQIEYYVSHIRPKIKEIFVERLPVDDKVVRAVFGLENESLNSTTSIINGFAFLRSSSNEAPSSYNRTFCEILQSFQDFGALTNIEPEFKLRLYEMFLRRSAKQQRLGQFFTPRNIVKAMIKMAQLNKLADDAVVLDPAAGVGGFLLEPLLFSDALPGNVRFEDGKPHQRVKLIGVDVDKDTNILAKANMLLHLAESVRDPSTTPSALNQAMANTFILLNGNETLGALEYPPRDSVDVILTNPPYVTQGSAIYRKEMEHSKGLRNGVFLKDYYDNGGLGVEALFLRYISGALRPGGIALVIVPLGLLNRTARLMKSNLLSECNIVGSIQLPRGAFFNTAQPTYILILEKRRVPNQHRPAVFCGLARTIGETLDHERVATPGENDLADLAELFVHFRANPASKVDRATPYEGSRIAKLVPSAEFGADERWDVIRHWSDDEYVALGVRAETIDTADFIKLAEDTLVELLDELRQAREEIDRLTAGEMTSLSLSNSRYFQIRSGVRIRNVDLRENPGNIPVYSVFTRQDTIKGRIAHNWLTERYIRPELFPSVTVMATGASAVGTVFTRENGCVVTDDVVLVQPWSRRDERDWLRYRLAKKLEVPADEISDEELDEVDPLTFTSYDAVNADALPSEQIDLNYLAVALGRTIAQGGYLYEAKLYTKRVSQLSIEVPVLADGSFDIVRQRQIADAAKRLDNIRSRLEEAGRWSKSVRLA